MGIVDDSAVEGLAFAPEGRADYVPEIHSTAVIYECLDKDVPTIFGSLLFFTSPGRSSSKAVYAMLLSMKTKKSGNPLVVPLMLHKNRIPPVSLVHTKNEKLL